MQQTTHVIDSVHNLEHAGMNRVQAEALTKLVRDSIAESVQHLATKAELAALRLEIKAEMARLNEQHLETKAELADLKAHVDARLLETKTEMDALRLEIKAEMDALRLETKAGLARLEASHKAQMEHTDAQIALLRGEITEKMGKNLKYMALTISLSTVATIAALFIAVFFAMPAAG